MIVSDSLLLYDVVIKSDSLLITVNSLFYYTMVKIFVQAVVVGASVTVKLVFCSAMME